MGEIARDKPLGRKCYGHIPHLPGSRMGPGDHKCHEGQERIATSRARDKHDRIIVQEKVDGSNVGIARLGENLYPLGRAGYLASSSPYPQHRLFSDWVYKNYGRFFVVLEDGERLCGEWLAQAHGTRYNLPGEPFVAFDLMRGMERAVFEEFSEKARRGDFQLPNTVHVGGPLSVEEAMALVQCSAFGALDPVEGAVWRVERNGLIGHTGVRVWEVDFVVKYVRPDKADGVYLPEISGEPAIWNWLPDQA